jgi:hypothetical protein
LTREPFGSLARSRRYAQSEARAALSLRTRAFHNKNGKVEQPTNLKEKEHFENENETIRVGSYIGSNIA